MVKSSIDPKTSTGNISQAKQAIIKNKRNNTIKLFFIIILLVILAWGGYTQYVSNVDRENVLTMRSSIKKMIARFKNAGIEQTWSDESSCEISRPSSFGERTRYFCNSHYTMNYPVSSQDDVDRLVGIISGIVNRSIDIVYNIDDNSLGAIELSNVQLENSYYNSINFKVMNVRTDQGGCYVRYIIAETKNSVRVDIECNASTRKAYFEPVVYT